MEKIRFSYKFAPSKIKNELTGRQRKAATDTTSDCGWFCILVLNYNAKLLENIIFGTQKRKIYLSSYPSSQRQTLNYLPSVSSSKPSANSSLSSTSALCAFEVLRLSVSKIGSSSATISEEFALCSS